MRHGWTTEEHSVRVAAEQAELSTVDCNVVVADTHEVRLCTLVDRPARMDFADVGCILVRCILVDIARHCRDTLDARYAAALDTVVRIHKLGCKVYFAYSLEAENARFEGVDRKAADDTQHRAGASAVDFVAFANRSIRCSSLDLTLCVLALLVGLQME